MSRSTKRRTTASPKPTRRSPSAPGRAAPGGGARSGPLPSPQEAPRPAPRATFGRAASAEPEAAAGDARARARNAASLEELEAILTEFDACPLRFTAKNLVFGDGNPQARVMFLGEAPGADEDRIGKPFMGRSGQLLDKMMAAIGLDRSSAYIANVVPWRPRATATRPRRRSRPASPSWSGRSNWSIPELIVCLGAPATQTLTGTKDGILKTRGRVFPYALPSREAKLLATLHPAFLLRQPCRSASRGGIPRREGGARRESLTVRAEPGLPSRH